MIDRITQDLKIMQVVVKEAVAANPVGGGGVNITCIGQIRVTSGGLEFLDKSEPESLPPLLEDKERTISIGINLTGSPKFFQELREVALVKGLSIMEQAQLFVVEGLRRSKMVKGVCEMDDCNQEVKSRGLCGKHYQRAAREMKEEGTWKSRK